MILDQRVWRIVAESQKPIKVDLLVPNANEVQSTAILSPDQKLPENRAKNKNQSKASSSIFAEALITPHPKRKSSSLPTMEKSRLTMARNSPEANFSKGNLPDKIQEINVVPTQTQVSEFVKNGEVDLHTAFNEVNRRASEIGCANFDDVPNVEKFTVNDAITAFSKNDTNLIFLNNNLKTKHEQRIEKCD